MSILTTQIIKPVYKAIGYYRLYTKDNFGVCDGKQDVSRLGSLRDQAVFEILNESGQWGVALPRIEYQRFAWGDTMACVTYSLLNTIETVAKYKYGENWDLTDRFTAKMSGTTRSGNWMYKVFDSIAEIDGPLSLSDNVALSWDDFYREPTELEKNVAKQNLDYRAFNIEWMGVKSPQNIREFLKYSPVWTCLYAYGPKRDGIYQRITGHSPNHAVMIYGYELHDDKKEMKTDADFLSNLKAWKIYDHYLGGEHRRLAPDYLFGASAKIAIAKK